MKVREVLALSSSCQDNHIRAIHSSHSFIWNLCVFSFLPSPHVATHPAFSLSSHLSHSLSQSFSSAPFHWISILLCLSIPLCLSITSSSASHTHTMTVRQSTFISVTVRVHLMATARFIPSCLVQRHVLHPRLCVELWVQDHDGICVLQDRVHTTLWSDRACLIFLLRSRAISSSLASVIRFRGQLFQPLQTSPPNFCFGHFSIFLKQNMLSIFHYHT